MANFFRRHPFLLVGIFTLCLFFLVAALNRVGQTEAAQAVAGPMRVLIVPMYVVWMVFTAALVAIAGPGGLPGPLAALAWGISLMAGLVPYALADYALDRWRHHAELQRLGLNEPNS